MSPLANLPGSWRWTERGEMWWRVHTTQDVWDGPHHEPRLCARIYRPSSGQVFICTLDAGHEPDNHEAWSGDELVAEWAS